MTEQPPSAEAMKLASRYADGEVKKCAAEIDALCEQRISAETERCAAIARNEPTRPNDDAAAMRYRIEKAIRAPAERPAPPQQHNWQESTDTCVVCFWNSNEPHCPKVCPGVPKWRTERPAPEGPRRVMEGMRREGLPDDHPLQSGPSALAAAASEHQAEIEAALAETEAIRVANWAWVKKCQNAINAKAALLARLLEPDVREAVKAAMRERDFARDGEYLPDDCYEAFADAALTKIAEMLK